ncbi:MAG: hypothetical protein LAP21_22000, partial [Acidobacteriia bacterium]|nr:hypothetical protein [Terriglobia bacterium]
IAAILTLVGYSMNDTIVVFDRIRENVKLLRRESLAEIVDRSINQTLSRTVLTSGLTFLTVLSRQPAWPPVFPVQWWWVKRRAPFVRLAAPSLRAREWWPGPTDKERTAFFYRFP